MFNFTSGAEGRGQRLRGKIFCTQVKTPAPVQLKKWRRQSVRGGGVVCRAAKKSLVFNSWTQSWIQDLMENYIPLTNTHFFRCPYNRNYPPSFWKKSEKGDSYSDIPWMVFGLKSLYLVQGVHFVIFLHFLLPPHFPESSVCRANGGGSSSGKFLSHESIPIKLFCVWILSSNYKKSQSYLNVHYGHENSHQLFQKWYTKTGLDKEFFSKL
jgi:hypothetical protein